jgi:hypothetical protein
MPDFDILQGPFTTDSVVSDDPGCDICLDRDIPEAGSPILIATMFADHKDDHPPHLLPPKLARKLALIFAAAPELLAAMPTVPHPGGRLLKVVAHYESGATQTIEGEVVTAAISKAKGGIR